MPKIRTLKREFFRSVSTSRLERPARLTIAGIIACLADDEGRFVADARLIRNEIYPFDDDMQDDVVEGHIRAAAGRRVAIIRLYFAKGCRYGVFPTWEKHQWLSRRLPSNLPAPIFRNRLSAAGKPLVPARESLASSVQPMDMDREKGRERDGSGKGEGTASRKLTGDDPIPGVGISLGNGHAEAVEIVKTLGLETKGILKRMGPSERTAAQEEAARVARSRRAKVSA